MTLPCCPILQKELGVRKPTTLHRLQDVGLSDKHHIEIAKDKPSVAQCCPQDLLQGRGAAHDHFLKTNLSKLFRKELRQTMQTRRNAQAAPILGEVEAFFFGGIFQTMETMVGWMSGGMLQGRLPPGSPRRGFM